MALTKISGEVLQQPINIGVITATSVTATSATFSDNVSIGAGATTAFFEVDTGNVGIGTDNPTNKLEVYGTNAEDVIRISTGNNAGDTFANIRGDNESGIRIRGGGSYDGGTIELAGGLRDTDPGIIKFSTGTGVSPSERLRITSGGNIGIGTDDPQTGLHIDSSSNAQSRITISRAGFLRNNFIGLDGDADELVIAADEGNQGDNSHIRFKLDGSEKLRISSGIGLVGIRTDDPKTNVDINLYTPTGNTYRGTVKINRYGHILQQNNQQVVLSGVSSYWALAPRDSGNLDISFDEPDVNFNIVNPIVTFTSSGNVQISDGNLVMPSGHGIDFSATGDSSGTMTSELLDDYEEGTFTMTMSCGGNTASQQCRYTKIGRIVYIDGHGTEVTDNYFNTGNNGADAAVTITTNLPFTPVRTGAAPITVSRTLKGANGFQYERMYVGWRKDSATIYLGSENNNYMPVDNVVTNNNQTNKTILFSGHFVTEV